MEEVCIVPWRRKCDDTLLLHRRAKIARRDDSEVVPKHSVAVVFLSSDGVLRVAHLNSGNEEPLLIHHFPLTRPDGVGYILLESRMYLVGQGYSKFSDASLDPRATYVYDLAKNDVLTECARSHTPKPNSLIASLEGKVCVLSVSREIDSAFEMFDPSTGIWSKLPAPPFLEKAFDASPRIAHCFVFRDTLYLKVAGDHLYYFSLTKQEWNVLYDFGHNTYRDFDKVHTAAIDICKRNLCFNEDIYQGKLYVVHTFVASANVCVYDLENPGEAVSKVDSERDASSYKIGHFTPHVVQGLDEVLGNLPCQSSDSDELLFPVGRVVSVDDKTNKVVLVCFFLEEYEYAANSVLMCEFELVKQVESSGAYNLRAENVSSKIMSCNVDWGQPIAYCIV